MKLSAMDVILYARSRPSLLKPVMSVAMSAVLSEVAMARMVLSLVPKFIVSSYADVALIQSKWNVTLTSDVVAVAVTFTKPTLSDVLLSL